MSFEFTGRLNILMKTAGTIRKVGIQRLAKSLLVLLAHATSAVTKLFVGSEARPSAPQSEPLDLSGTGGHYNARTGNYDNGQDPFGMYPDDDRSH